MLYIFDWDGTLSQSLDNIVAAIEEAAADTGLPALAEERNRSVIGLSLENAFATLYPEVDSRQLDLLLERYRACYLQLNYQKPSPLFEGVEETLSVLMERGHDLAIATGKRREGLNRVLEHSGIGHLFRATRCTDEAHSKPDPLMLLQLLEITGYRPSEAVVVGDTDFDLQMATNANIPSIGVTYGAHPEERLKSCSPLMLISDIRKLQEVSW